MNQPLNSLLQLVTLGIGIVIGVLIAPRFNHQVSAQTATQSTAASSSTPRIIELQSYQSGPALAANVVLAGQLQADRAIVNGFDLLAIDQNIVNYLATLPVSNPTALKAIGETARATTLYSLPRPRSQEAPGATPVPGVPVQGPPH